MKTKISSPKFVRHSQATRLQSSWFRFSLVVHPRDRIAATALLEAATGAQAAIQERVARATVHVPLREACAARHRLRSALSRARSGRLVGRIKVEEEAVSSTRWDLSWKKFYRPLRVAPRLFVAPTWERRFRPPHGARCIRLDPGMAFGTGQHPSTQLALELLLRCVRPRSIVLDLGCGSGILGIAAAQAGARVWASDPDPIAVAAAGANFQSNGLRPEAVVSGRDLPDRFPAADVIVANLSAALIVRLAAGLSAGLKRKGVLISSGIVPAGEATVLAALERAGLRLVQRSSVAEWRAFVHRKLASR